MTLSLPLLAAARTYADRLRAEFADSLLDVRLFGSGARGQAHEDSDADIFVLLRQVDWARRCRVLDLAGDVWHESGVLISPLVMEEVLFQTWRRQDRPLVRDILAQGVSL